MVKPQTISMRQVTPEDEAFLLELYASTRADVQAWECSNEEKDAFLEMQYRIQEQFFQSQYPNADQSVIQNGEKRMGRLYTAEDGKEIRILDITLLQEYRCSGIGSSVIGRVLEKAKKVRLPVRLMVERFNRARSLYERLGFQIIEDAGTHYLIEWTP
ncbi:MAG: GNAT family N-acetyltransferase [candidate division Zixibacteria bacterium]|nr:GNAT family N-acetyltransferase [Gammaproteobacteria bacterium]NIR63863.1 GNAT family N-acetyltransferase [candidate division Zixibacteria bacterium]NIX00028.1 GNAT family N-acetyltransferase [Phycisphaerae bacterium]